MQASPQAFVPAGQPLGISGGVAVGVGVEFEVEPPVQARLNKTDAEIINPPKILSNFSFIFALLFFYYLNEHYSPLLINATIAAKLAQIIFRTGLYPYFAFFYLKSLIIESILKRDCFPKNMDLPSGDHERLEKYSLGLLLFVNFFGLPPFEGTIQMSSFFSERDTNAICLRSGDN
jgi:hypothetical protein